MSSWYFIMKLKQLKQPGNGCSTFLCKTSDTSKPVGHVCIHSPSPYRHFFLLVAENIHVHTCQSRRFIMQVVPPQIYIWAPLGHRTSGLRCVKSTRWWSSELKTLWIFFLQQLSVSSEQLLEHIQHSLLSEGFLGCAQNSSHQTNWPFSAKY